MIRIKPPLTGSQWADEYFYLSPESSSVLGKWKTLPFQIGPLNWMCDDDIEQYNEQKSRRTGYTKRMLCAMGYYIENKRRNVVIWQPTDGDRDRFSKVEVDTMLRDVPVLGDNLMCAVGSKSKYNTTDQKTFAGVTLDLKGGKSAKNYRAMTKDVGMYDELSAFDSDVDKEGSPTTLGDGRLDDSPFPKSIRGSTPKMKGPCLIEQAIESCNHLFWRYMPCPSCGHMHRLEFENLKWDDRDHLSARFICPENGCVIDYSQYPDMDKKGQWRTTDGYYYREDTDSFYNPEDEITEKPLRISVRIWAAYSYFKPWSHIAELWISASKRAKTGDTTELKSIVNTILGETWEEKSDSVAATGFMNRLEDYGFDTLPVEILLITFGADVQGGTNPRIELEILGHGIEGETWSIDYVVIPGDPEQFAVWSHLYDEVKRKFTRTDGIKLGVSGGFIDSGYLKDEVYRFTGPRRKRNIYATKGVNTGTICNKGTWQGDTKAARAILHTVNVDDAKEITFKRLQKSETEGPGVCHFPVHYKQSFFDGLTNEKKRKKMKAGRVLGYEWVKKSDHKPNEQLDCRSYNQGILARLNPNLPRLKMILEEEAKRIQLNIPIEPRRGMVRKVRGKRG